jgi:hypothetical protein
MPDQMPAHRNVYHSDFLQRFLNFVLTDVVQPHIVRRASGLGPMGLSDRDDRYLLRVPTARCRCLDSGPHVGNTLSQAGESHSCQT